MVAHYEGEAQRVGIAGVVEELVHLVAGVALVEPVPDSDALDAAQSLGDDVEQVDETGRVARWAVHPEGAGALPAVQWHALGTVHPEATACPVCRAVCEVDVDWRLIRSRKDSAYPLGNWYRREEVGRIEIILSRFVNDPDQPVFL